MTVRSRIRVTGIVQGVGFRPFVHGVAAELGLAGFVGNDESGVVIEAEGPAPAVEALVTALRERPPPLACVTGVTAAGVPVQGGAGFGIVPSTANGHRVALVAADTATCADCLAELRDPADRRYRHPFITCTNCGPRFTIVTGVPYDRAATTMAGFPMCAACAAEYHDPADRRFHAQPVCCPDCGPTLRFTGGPGDPVVAAADALRAGAVIAVKGLGGYHLAALAGDESAVAALRARKHREDKPFAVLATGLDGARELGEVERGRGRRADVPPGADRAAAQAAGRPAGRCRRSRQRPRRGAAALHADPPPAPGRARRSHRADQRERLRRADRPPRRRRFAAARRRRGRVPDARPAHPHPRGRLGAAGRARAGVPGAPVARVRAGTAGARRRRRRAGARLRRRAQEHLLRAAGIGGVPVAPRGRPGERRDARRLHRRDLPPPAAARRRAAGARARPAPGVPLHEVRARAGRGRPGAGSGRRAAPPRAPGGVSRGERRGGAGDRDRVRRARLRHRRRALGRRGARRLAQRVPQARPPGTGSAPGRGHRHPPAVADGGGLAAGRRRRSGRARRRHPQRRAVAAGGTAAGLGRRRPCDHQCRTALRRGRGARRRARRRELRGPGGDRAGAVRGGGRGVRRLPGPARRRRDPGRRPGRRRGSRRAPGRRRAGGGGAVPRGPRRRPGLRGRGRRGHGGAGRGGPVRRGLPEPPPARRADPAAGSRRAARARALPGAVQRRRHQPRAGGGRRGGLRGRPSADPDHVSAL